MPTAIPESIIKASNYIYLSMVLGIINPLLKDTLSEPFIQANITPFIYAILISSGILFLLGFLVRKGFKFMRYILLVLIIFEVGYLPGMYLDYLYEPFIIREIYFGQPILRIFALLSLFSTESNLWYNSLVKNKG